MLTSRHGLVYIQTFFFLLFIFLNMQTCTTTQEIIAFIEFDFYIVLLAFRNSFHVHLFLHHLFHSASYSYVTAPCYSACLSLHYWEPPPSSFPCTCNSTSRTVAPTFNISPDDNTCGTRSSTLALSSILWFESTSEGSE